VLTAIESPQGQRIVNFEVPWCRGVVVVVRDLEVASTRHDATKQVT